MFWFNCGCLSLYACVWFSSAVQLLPVVPPNIQDTSSTSEANTWFRAQKTLLRSDNTPQNDIRKRDYQVYFRDNILPQVNLPPADAQVITQDTHGDRCLERSAPDMSTYPEGYALSSCVVSAIVEIKPRSLPMGSVPSCSLRSVCSDCLATR